LFIVFVNDICEVVPGGVTVKLFADDTKLYSVIRNTVDRDKLQSCLTAIFERSAHCQLSLSPSKCSLLQVSPAHVNSHCDYHINDVNLPNADSVSDLGVLLYILIKLSLKPHLDLNLILNCFQSRNPTMLVKAFCTLVRPTLEYCSVVWGPGFKKTSIGLKLCSDVSPKG